jgi:hypothetical protein
LVSTGLRAKPTLHLLVGVPEPIDVAVLARRHVRQEPQDRTSRR